MATIQWSIKFETGSSEFDEMNKKFVKIINRISDLSLSVSIKNLNDIMQDLFFYIDKQFSFEENLFEISDYHDSLKHRHDHDSFRSVIKIFEEQVVRGIEIEKVTNDLSRYLKNWFLTHILGEDRKFFIYKKSS